MDVRLLRSRVPASASWQALESKLPGPQILRNDDTVPGPPCLEYSFARSLNLSLLVRLPVCHWSPRIIQKENPTAKILSRNTACGPIILSKTALDCYNLLQVTMTTAFCLRGASSALVASSDLQRGSVFLRKGIYCEATEVVRGYCTYQPISLQSSG